MPDDAPVQAPVDLTDPAAADTFIAWAFGDDDTPPFGTPDPAPPARVWTDEDYAAFDRRYPNGPFADHPDDTPGTDTDDTLDTDDDHRRADCRAPRPDHETRDEPPIQREFTRFNATGLLSTSQTTRTRTRHELRQLLTHCTRKPPADNDSDDAPA